jgi:hypothetical protein
MRRFRVFLVVFALSSSICAQSKPAPIFRHPPGSEGIPASFRWFRQNPKANTKSNLLSKGFVSSNESSLLDFAPVVNYGSGGVNDSSIAVADLNGDGRDDIVVVNGCSQEVCANTVGVLLGNGNGTFQPPVTYALEAFTAGVSPGINTIAIADINGDGKPDLLAASPCTSLDTSSECADYDGVVSVLLGNGDGTFQNATGYWSGGQIATSIEVADINGDGHPDIVAVNLCPSGPNNNDITSRCQFGGYSVVGVLLGNGDGTFQPAQDYSSGGYYSISGVLADVNGDGKLDVVIGNQIDFWPDFENGSVGVLLGNGDGSFQEGSPVIFTAQNVDFATVADVNGDGHTDLLVPGAEEETTCMGNTCTSSPDYVVLMSFGNGDGTFQSPSIVPTNTNTETELVAADVNGDGKVDLLLPGVDVLLGNGDGTFQSDQTFSSGGGDAIAVADVDANGKLDLLVANGGVGVLINETSWPTTTTLTSSINPTSFGQSLTLTATITEQGAKAMPSGTVTFTDGSAIIGAASVIDGIASLNTSTLVAGTHTITATYGGDGNYAVSTSAALTQVVNVVPTNITLSSNANPVEPNQQITYTATVTGQYGGVLTGSVRFHDNQTTAVIPISAGVAVLTESYSATGTHSIVASYSGDTNNLSSTSAVLTEYVQNFPIPTTTTVVTSGSPSVVNSLVTFTATVTPKHGSVPNGESVTFYDGTTQIGTGKTVSNVATFVTAALSVKAHSIKAIYLGDSTFKTSSGTVQQVVKANGTTTSLSVNPSPLNYGQTVVLTAVVTSSGSSVPTGKITFFNGTTVLGSSALSSTGVSTLTTTKLPVGSGSLTATYGGDSQNAKSTSAPVTQLVNQAVLSMSVSSSLNPSASGRLVRFTATMTSNGSLPNGQQVTFTYNGATIGRGTISGGKATFSTSSLPAGSDLVTVNYAGNADYVSATASITQIVN